MDSYYVVINGRTSGYQNGLQYIKNALYDLFGDIPIATEETVMSSVVNGVMIEIEENV